MQFGTLEDSDKIPAGDQNNVWRANREDVKQVMLEPLDQPGKRETIERNGGLHYTLGDTKFEDAWTQMLSWNPTVKMRTKPMRRRENILKKAPYLLRFRQYNLYKSPWLEVGVEDDTADHETDLETVSMKNSAGSSHLGGEPSSVSTRFTGRNEGTVEEDNLSDAGSVHSEKWMYSAADSVPGQSSAAKRVVGDLVRAGSVISNVASVHDAEPPASDQGTGLDQ